MKNEALGMVETKGLVGSIKAADAMCKAADVELIVYENVSSGLISVIVAEDVGAVKSAVEVGVKRAEEVGNVYCQLVIPSPHEGIEMTIRRYAFLL